MRAAVVERYGAPDVLTVVEQPIPTPGPEQVSIDVAYAGVNYAEVMARRGSLPNFAPPFVPGLEVSGTVRALGPGVDDVEIGQPVCALTTRGGYAEVAVAPAATTYALATGDDDSLRRGAAMPTIAPTAHALVREVARLRQGDRILVHAAAGGVGTVLGQIARREGAGTVIGVASTSEKAEYAKGFGYDDVVVGPEWSEAALQRSGGRGFDVIFDSIGGAVRARSFELLAPLGRLVAYGNACDEPEVGFTGGVMRAQVKGMLGFSITALAVLDPARVRTIAEEALAAVVAGSVRIPITDVHPLEDAWRAHESLESRRSTGKLILALV